MGLRAGRSRVHAYRPRARRRCKFVTIGMDRVEFRRPVRAGAILRFSVQRDQAGNSSVRYIATVYRDDIETGVEEAIFSTHVSFVCLDDKGGKQPLPPG